MGTYSKHKVPQWERGNKIQSSLWTETNLGTQKFMGTQMGTKAGATGSTVRRRERRPLGCKPSWGEYLSPCGEQTHIKNYTLE